MGWYDRTVDGCERRCAVYVMYVMLPATSTYHSFLSLSLFLPGFGRQQGQSGVKAKVAEE